MRSRKSFLGNSPGFAGGRAARLRPVPRSRAAPGGRGAGEETEGPRPRSGNGLRARGLQRDGRPAGPRSPWKVPASRVPRGAAPSSAPWRPASLGTPPGRHRQPLHAADSRQLAFPAPPSRIAGRDPGGRQPGCTLRGFRSPVFPYAWLPPPTPQDRCAQEAGRALLESSARPSLGRTHSKAGGKAGAPADPTHPRRRHSRTPQSLQQRQHKCLSLALKTKPNPTFFKKKAWAVLLFSSPSRRCASRRSGRTGVDNGCRHPSRCPVGPFRGLATTRPCGAAILARGGAASRSGPGPRGACGPFFWHLPSPPGAGPPSAGSHRLCVQLGHG